MANILETTQLFYLFPVFAKKSHWFQLSRDLPGPRYAGWFGGSVSISADGRRVACGAKLSGRNGRHSGHATVYEWSGTRWLQLGEEIIGDSAGDHAGTSVSLSANGQVVAVASPLNGDNGTAAGKVVVYRWSELGWQKLGADILGDMAGATTGWVSLSSDGSRLAVASPHA